MSQQAYHDRRVLVLGASGFIGAYTARTLHAAGAALHVAARDPGAARRGLPVGVPDHAIHTLDATAPNAVAELVERVAPDITFNGIGYGVDRRERDPALFEALNAHLPEVLARACVGLPDGTWPGQRLVHIGSALEYGTATGDLREDGPHMPTTPYGQTKLAGTSALSSVVESTGLRALTARLFTVYGPGEHSTRLLPTLLAARHGEVPIPFTEGLQQRDFTYVGDVAEGLLRLGALPGRQPSVVNLATGSLHSVRHFVETALRELSLAPSRVQFGALPTRPEEMHHDPVTVARLVAATGWKPNTSIAEGIRKTLRETPP